MEPSNIALIGFDFKYCYFCICKTMKLSKESPKNWSEWNKTKYFSDYSRDSETSKFVRFAITAFIFIPVGFLPYMTTI